MVNLKVITAGSGAPGVHAATTREVHWLAEHFPNPADQREYARLRCVEAVGSAVERAMDSANLNRAALARRLGWNPAQVTRVMRGAHNMTLFTLGDILWACGKELRDLSLIPLGVIEVATDDASQWRPVPKSGSLSGVG